MAENKKKRAISLERKLQILHDVDMKTGLKSAVAAKHGISASTLSTILKNRVKINDAFSDSSHPLTSKRMRESKNGKILDDAVYTWFKQTRSQGVPISGPLLLSKAQELATELAIDFAPNNGWLHRFKKRRAINCKAITGESLAVTPDMTDRWFTKDLPDLLTSFEPEDIYNCDETGLFFRCLPSRTLAFKGDQCKGGKIPKERLTVLITASMAGEKLPLFVIGKFQKPRCFAKVTSLPVKYVANKRAWMTGVIFEEWVRNLDAKMLHQGRKIALVIDNCPAHPKLQNLKAIKLVFLPANTTSHTQPCDQGIIRNFKCYYRQVVVHKLLLHISDKESTSASFKLNVLDALHIMRSSWSYVEEKSIVNCFRHAGFVSAAAAVPIADDDNQEAEAEEVPVAVMAPPGFSQLGEGVSWEDFVHVDDEVETTAVLSVKEIADSVREISLCETVVEEEEDDSVTREIPTSKQAATCVDTLMDFLQMRPLSDASDTFMDNLRAMQTFIHNTAITEAKQTSITDFFRSK